jgi:hypothetical protein
LTGLQARLLFPSPIISTAYTRWDWLRASIFRY